MAETINKTNNKYTLNGSDTTKFSTTVFSEGKTSMAEKTKESTASQKEITASHNLPALENVLILKLDDGREVKVPLEGESVTYNDIQIQYEKHIKMAHIPSNVKYIATEAFCDCTNLEEINIPNSVKIIGKRAFANCVGLAEINIPNSVEEIGPAAFCQCTRIREVNIPNGVRKIAGSAFIRCASLVSVNVSDSVLEIGSLAFAYCPNLAKVRLSNNLKIISREMFKECKSLRKIVIPENVTQIEESDTWDFNPFSECRNLELIMCCEAPINYDYLPYYNEFHQTNVKYYKRGEFEKVVNSLNYF